MKLNYSIKLIGGKKLKDGNEDLKDLRKFMKEEFNLLSKRNLSLPIHLFQL